MFIPQRFESHFVEISQFFIWYFFLSNYRDSNFLNSSSSKSVDWILFGPFPLALPFKYFSINFWKRNSINLNELHNIFYDKKSDILNLCLLICEVWIFYFIVNKETILSNIFLGYRLIAIILLVSNHHCNTFNGSQKRVSGFYSPSSKQQLIFIVFRRDSSICAVLLCMYQI